MQLLSHADIMAQLNQIIDLGALANCCVSPKRRTVNGRVCPDLHIVLDDGPSDLREIWSCPPAVWANPKPSLPSTVPACRMTRLPSTVPAMSEQFG
jgi:hypothetical protein